jgi:O-antigen ligase
MINFFSEEIFVNHKKVILVLISLLVAIVSTIVIPYNYIILLLIFTVFILYYYGKNAILLFVLVNYLTSLSEYIGNLRVYLNLISTFALLYLFLQEYRLNFSEYPKLPKGIIIFIILLFINLIISTINSAYLYDGISAIITTGFFLIICYMLYGLIKDLKTIDVYLVAIWLAFILISIRMFYDLITLGFQVFFLRSILEIKEQLAGNLGYTHITVFFISITFISSFLLRKNIHIRKKSGLVLLMLINVISLIFANARAAIIAAILSNFLLFVITKQRALFKLIFFVAVSFLCVYIFVPEIETTVNLYLRIDSINDRMVFWQASLDVIAKNPILGVGPRAFYHYFFSYAPSYIFNFLEMDLWNNRPTPHNLFLMYWVENGIGGILLMISLFVLYFRYCYKVLKITKERHDQLFLITASITGLGVGFLFRSFFEISGILHYGFITTDLPFWLILMIVLRIYHYSSAGKNLKNEFFQFSNIKST